MIRQTAASVPAAVDVSERHGIEVAAIGYRTSWRLALPVMRLPVIRLPVMTLPVMTLLAMTLLLSGLTASAVVAAEPMTDVSAAGSQGVAVAQSADTGPEVAHQALMANDCLPAPQGPVILTISGVLDCGNGGNADAPVANFDMAMLDALPSRVTATHTPWTQGRVSFSGPLIRTLVERVADEGVQTVQVRALNDFAAEIPFSDVANYDVLLATRRDGAVMPVRDLGPLFILYPFDAHPELLNEDVRFRSVWQVRELMLR